MDAFTILADQAMDTISARQIAGAEDLFEPAMTVRYGVLVKLAKRIEAAVTELRRARVQPENVLYPSMPSPDLARPHR